MRILALDLGSSFTKAALLVDGSVQRERQLPTPGPLQTGPDRYEIDAETYYQQARSLIDDCLDEGDVQGILFSTQMHGFVLTDGKMRPCTPYVSWRDQLGTKHLPVLRGMLTAEDVQPSGVPLKGNLALCSLLARRAAGEVIPDGALLHTLGGYIIARLTGRHVCHITNAAPTGLADICREGWNHPLLKKAGLQDLRLPQVVTELRPVGRYRGAMVYPDIGDQQVCAYGAALQPEQSLHVNVGTAGLLGALCRDFKVDGCESRPWLEKGWYLRTVSGLAGGRHVQALREQYPGPDDQVWQMLTRTPDKQASAFFQEMADNYRQAAEKMDFPVGELCYSGGCVLKNPALRSRMEAVFGLPEEGGTKTSDIWTGMLRLAEKINNRSDCEGNMMNTELLRHKLKNGETAIGIMLSEIYVPNIVRLLACCGYDYILIDCEHGYFDMSHVANLVAVADGANIPVIVRVTQPSRTNITKYLDMGAKGILLSDVNSRADAERLASLCRYAPEGNRGVSTFRAHTGYSNGDVGQIMRDANERVIVICQIESPETVDNIDEITSIPGVDGVLIGPNDLSQHMGIFGEYKHPRMVQAMKDVAESAKKNGKWSGVITANNDLLTMGRDFGMTCFSVGSELNAIYNGATQSLQHTRALMNKEGNV